MTKDDQRQYEQRIQELKEERDQLKIKAEKADTVESTIDDAVDRSLKAVQQNYEAQIEQLQAENAQLRDSLETLSENVVTESDLEDLEADIDEMVSNYHRMTRRKISDERKEAEKHIDSSKDDVVDEVKLTRPLPVVLFFKIAVWLGAISHRVKILRGKWKIR
jgi:chromosome segregation ATPase